jgi:hypothetical protein
MKIYFTEKCDGPSTKKYIKGIKSKYPNTWKHHLYLYLKDEATIWRESLDDPIAKMRLPDEEYEKKIRQVSYPRRRLKREPNVYVHLKIAYF